jgi:large subunit ribosomal protein L21
MYAIVEIQGQQFKVEKDRKLYVHRLPNEEGSSLEIKEVLLIDNKGKIKVGSPLVKGAKVTAKVLKHVKGDKVLVFKKKRRKGYQKLNGHRQFFTQILIEDIKASAPRAKKPVEKKVEEEPKIEE